MQYIVKVERKVKSFDTEKKKWNETNSSAYYLSTITLSANKMAEIIRNHWGIETRNHYVRDVSMKEDFSRIRINAGIFARFRSFALNILRTKKSKNIKKDLYINALDYSRALLLKGLA